MIRFSAFLVAVAVGLLVAGVVTSKLLLVYIAIDVSGVALLALGVGAVIKRSELFGKPKTAEPELGQPEPVGAQVPTAQPEPQVVPQPATVPAGSGWPATAQPGPSQAGYPPAEQPPRTEPAAATGAPGRALPAEAIAGGVSAAAAWGSGIPPAARPAAPAVGTAVEQPQSGSPGGRTADVQRPFAAFTPRAADRQRAEEGQLASEDRQAARDQPPVEDQKAREDQEAKEREQPAEQPQSQELAPAAPPAVPPAVSQTAEPAPDLQREVTVVPGVPRYHNARCILIRFMGDNDLEKMTLGAARKAGCTPCRACLPDQPESNPHLPPN